MDTFVSTSHPLIFNESYQEEADDVLHYILKKDKDSLIRRFFNAQSKTPGNNDWLPTIQKNMEELNILVDIEQIEKSSKTQFNTLVDNCINEKCLNI